MASKGERTRARVLDEAARTFNSRGYAATPISALLAETGLEKGGLYHHFAGGKAELELAAFGHAVALVEQRLLVDPAQSGLVRLRGFLQGFLSIVLDPPVPGGCPVLNAAVETAGLDSDLRAAVRAVVERWLDRLEAAARDALAEGDLHPSTDPAALASTILATLEGAAMLAVITGRTRHARRAVAALSASLDVGEAS